MTNIKEEVQKNIKELQQVKLELEEKIKNEPEGSLRISRSSAGKPRYYHKYMNKDNETVDSFTGDEQLVQKLAEKSYYHKMLSCVEKELQALKNFEKHYFPEKRRIFTENCHLKENPLLMQFICQKNYVQNNGKSSSGKNMTSSLMDYDLRQIEEKLFAQNQKSLLPIC